MHASLRHVYSLYLLGHLQQAKELRYTVGDAGVGKLGLHVLSRKGGMQVHTGMTMSDLAARGV